MKQTLNHLSCEKYKVKGKNMLKCIALSAAMLFPQLSSASQVWNDVGKLKEKQSIDRVTPQDTLKDKSVFNLDVSRDTLSEVEKELESYLHKDSLHQEEVIKLKHTIRHMSRNVAQIIGNSCPKRFEKTLDLIFDLIEKFGLEAVFLQEVFPKKMQKMLQEYGKKKGRKVVIPAKSGLNVYGPGLVSMFPSGTNLIHQDFVPFTHECDRDLGAQKGFQIVVVQNPLGGLTMYINTHNQASYGSDPEKRREKKIRKVRAKQVDLTLEYLHQLLKAKKLNITRIVWGGDFNIPRAEHLGDSEEYDKFVGQVKGYGLEHVLGIYGSQNNQKIFGTNGGGEGKFLDYIFSRHSITVPLTEYIPKVQNDLIKELSDHIPVGSVDTRQSIKVVREGSRTRLK